MFLITIFYLLPAKVLILPNEKHTCACSFPFRFVRLHLLVRGANTCTRTVQLDDKHVLMLLDSTSAAAAIVQDRYDRYFERVQFGEMTIQMKRFVEKADTREAVLPFYKEFLQTDVANFNEKEAKFALEVMEKAFKTTAGVAANLFRIPCS